MSLQENEDFIGATFGFPLELEEDGRCMTLLAAVEETLAKQLKAARAGLSVASREGKWSVYFTSCSLQPQHRMVWASLGETWAFLDRFVEVNRSQHTILFLC